MALRFGRVDRFAAVAAILCIAWIAFAAPRSVDDRGVWAQTALPLIEDTEPLWLLAYTHIVGGHAIQRENIPTMNGVAMLEGAPIPGDFFHARLIYNFVSSLIVPFAGFFAGFLALNLLAWAGLAYLSWRLARSLGKDSAAGAVSAVLTVTSLAPIVHVSDYSAHLFSAMTYLAGFVALHETEVWKRARTWKVHLGLGLCLAVAVLTYNSGLVLALIYVAFAWRHNDKRYVLAAAAIAFSAGPIWSVILDLIATTPIQHVEAVKFGRSLGMWYAMLTGHPLDLVTTIIKYVAQNVTIDTPLIMPLGLAATFCAPILRGRRLLLLAAILAPFAALMPWLPVSGATIDYSMFGLLPVLHAAIAAWIAPLFRGRYKIAAITGATALVAAQLVWSTGPMRGWFVPLFAYFYGPFDIGGLWATHPIVASLTGMEPTPHLFGGPATLAEAGLGSQPAMIIRYGYNTIHAILAKVVPAAYCLALLAVVFQGRRRIYAVATLGALVVASSVVAPITNVQPPLMMAEWEAISLRPETDLTYQADVSEAFAARVAGLPTDAGTTLYIGMTGGRGDCAVEAGGQALRPTNTRAIPDYGLLITVDRADLSRGLAADHRLWFRCRGTTPLIFAGWQRAGLPGRAMAPPGPTLPLFEIRARALDGTLLLAGF